MTFGVVKHWQVSKGFGFVTTDDDRDVFLHVSELSGNLTADKIKPGMRLRFDVKSDMKGDKAVNVRSA